MYVRIARFEGSEPGETDQSIDRVRQEMQGPPPPGLEGAKRVMMLVDRESGRGAGVTFFETEEDMRRGDEALNAMTPGAGVRRASVEMYEVAIDQSF